MSASYRSVYRSPSVAASSSFATHDTKLGPNLSSPVRTYNNVTSPKGRASPTSFYSTRQSPNSNISSSSKSYDVPLNTFYDHGNGNGPSKRCSNPSKSADATADTNDVVRSTTIDNIYSPGAAPPKRSLTNHSPHTNGVYASYNRYINNSTTKVPQSDTIRDGSPSPTELSRGPNTGEAPHGLDGEMQMEDSSALAGGAVGLWRMARDGNSPARARESQSIGHYDGTTDTDSPYLENGTSASMPTNGSTFGTSLEFGRPASRLHTDITAPSIVGGPGGGNPTANDGNDTRRNTKVTTTPLVNMSLDSVMMGGFGGRVANTSVPLKSFTTSIGPPTRTAFGSNRGGGGIGTNFVASSVSLMSNQGNAFSGLGQRNSSAACGSRNFLIPHLQLPTYERQITRATIGANDITTSKTETQSYHPSWVTIVFDLDETLCNNRRAGKAALRPGCMDILRSLAAIRDAPEKNCYIEIILWTASIECVARPVTDRLDPHDTIFDHLIFRDRRWYKEMRYTKDLRLLGRDMSHVVIIENSPQSVYLNRRHAILVKDYVGGGGMMRSHFFGGHVNSPACTNSATDPSLYIVLQVLTDWAADVGKQGLQHQNLQLDGTGTQNKGTFSSQHDPVSVSLPGPLGIVEFLRENPYINPGNEVIINTSNRHLGAKGGTTMSPEKGGILLTNNASHRYQFHRPSTSSGMSSYQSAFSSSPVDRLTI